MDRAFSKTGIVHWYEQDQIGSKRERLRWYESEHPESTPPSVLSLVLRKLFRSD